MSEEKVWTEDQIEQAAQKIDDLVEANGIVEMFDGPAAKIALQAINNLITKYAPKWSWVMIQSGMVAFLNWEKPTD